jgi:hypothetical protein
MCGDEQGKKKRKLEIEACETAFERRRRRRRTD